MFNTIFIYNKELNYSPFTLYKVDVNLTVALGWLSIYYFTILVAGIFLGIFGWNLFISAVAGELVVGNILGHVLLA